MGMQGLMYQTHFGFEKRLFDEGVAADPAVFRNRQHTELVEQLKLAFASSTSVVVLRGPAGVGKSTLISAALRASGTRLALAWLNGTPTNAAELLELLLVELGINTARTSRIERLQLWRQFQAETAATDSRLFVVAERTEDLPVEVLHALDSSTAADAAGHPGANVVLLGHARIEDHLADPVLDSLRQRIRLRAELKPFTEAELEDYLRHRVTVAGGQFDRTFASGAVSALHRYSRGVARLANNLCEMALTLAASRGQKTLTAELVNEAAVTWLGLSEPQPVAVPPVASTTPIAAKPAAPAAPPPILKPASAAPAIPQVAATVFTVSPVPIAPLPPPTVAASISFAPSAPSAVAAPVPPAAVTPDAPVAPARPAVAQAPVAPPSPPATPVAPTVTAPPPAPRTAPPASTASPRTATPQAPAIPRPALAPAVVAAPPPVAQEYDGGATDIPDVSIVDFPVLTDAVDVVDQRAPAPTPVATPAPPKPQPKAPVSPVASSSPPPRAATPPPAAARPTPAPPAAAPPPRIETAYTAARAAPPAKPVAPAAPTPKVAAPAAAAKPSAAPPPKPAVASAPPKPAAPRAPEPKDEDDLLRQTQTMRAISEAKSIVDISDSMAETLFGDAELDFLSASLASAANWTEADATAAPAKKPASSTPAPTKPAQAAPSDNDDLLDLLGLSDAPLELIDDSAQPPSGQPRKSGTQR
jgi:type II secretory pathway predicted ATPase ExeA